MPELSLIDSVRSSYEDVHKLVFKDEDVLEVSYIRKGDGKDILCVRTVRVRSVRKLIRRRAREGRARLREGELRRPRAGSSPSRRPSTSSDP